MLTTFSECPYYNNCTCHTLCTPCSSEVITVSACHECHKYFHRCNALRCYVTPKFPFLIVRHINHVHPNVGTTTDDNVDDSVAGHDSFDGNAPEFSSEEGDALSHAVAVQNDKSEEEEMAEAIFFTVPTTWLTMISKKMILK